MSCLALQIKPEYPIFTNPAGSKTARTRQLMRFTYQDIGTSLFKSVAAGRKQENLDALVKNYGSEMVHKAVFNIPELQQVI